MQSKPKFKLTKLEMLSFNDACKDAGYVVIKQTVLKCSIEKEVK